MMQMVIKMRISIELELTPTLQAHKWLEAGYTASGAIDAKTKVMAKVTCPVGPQPAKIKTTMFERTCLKYVAQGLRIAEIAQKTHKTTSRINDCLNALRRKFDCREKNNTALVLKAINMGVLDD